MIPKKAFCVWPSTSDFRLSYLCYLSMKSFLLNNPDCSLTLITSHFPDGKYWQELSSHVSLSFVQPAQPQTIDDCIAESDLQRIRALSNGGIYFDLDILFFDKIPETLFDHPLVMVRSPESKALFNFFIMASQDSDVFEGLTEKTERLHQRGKKFGSSWLKQPEKIDHGKICILDNSNIIAAHPKDQIYKGFLYSDEFDPDTAFAIHWWSRFLRIKQGLSIDDLPYSGTAFERYAEEIRKQ